MSNPFTLRGVYNFTTYAPHILKSEFRNATCVTLTNYTTASQISDVATIHSQVYPSLPPGTPTDFRQIDYAIFLLPTGQTTIMGIPWIKPDSIQKVQSVTITAKIVASDANDLPAIQQALASIGLTNVEYSVSSV